MSWYPKKLDISAGESLTETELEYLDNITPGTVAVNKAIVPTTNKHIDAIAITDGGLALGAGAGTAVTATAAELNYNDHGAGAATPGTAVASKTAILGATKNLDTFATADLKLGAAGAEVSVTATAAELNYNDRVGGVGVAEASKTAVLGTNKNLDVLAVADLKLGAGAGTSITADATQLNSCDANVGAAAGTGVVAVETGFGNFKTTTLTFTDTPVVLADEAGVVAYGGLKVYDMPQGYIYMQSAVSNLAITKSSAGVNDNWDGDIGVGTVTAANDATLSVTEQNIIPTTATPQAAAGATTGDAVSTATEHAILDGTTTAVDVFVNLLVDDADHDVTTTPCNLILNGTLVLNWIFMGDN